MSSSTPGFRVAVVTPYYQEEMDVLRKCHRSVCEQTYPCVHFLIADGSPAASGISVWPAVHMLLSQSHGNAGNTPRGFGSLSAMYQGYDAIAYLDADNWYYPSHVESMVSLHRRTGAVVCTATRTFHRLDGSLMYTDVLESDGRRHVDTSCLFLTRAAFGILPLWSMMPKQLGPVGDRVIWDAILSRGFSHARDPEPTVAYRTQYHAHYLKNREPPPEVRDHGEDVWHAQRWWESLAEEERDHWRRLFAGTPAPSAPVPVRTEPLVPRRTIVLPSTIGPDRHETETSPPFFGSAVHGAEEQAAAKDRERNNWRIFTPLALPSPRRETAEKVARTYYLLWIDRETAPSGRMPQRLFQQSRRGEGAADSYSFRGPKRMDDTQRPRKIALASPYCLINGSSGSSNRHARMPPPSGFGRHAVPRVLRGDA